MNKKQSIALEAHFADLHANPPAAFNPDYNPEYVARTKAYATELGKYQDSLPDSMSDEMFNALVRKEQRRLQKKFGMYVRMGCLPDEEITGMYCSLSKSNFKVNYSDGQTASPVFDKLDELVQWLHNEGVAVTAGFRIIKSEVSHGR